MNKDAWENFGTHYMLGNLLEIEPCTLMRNEGVRKMHYYVKLGSTSCHSASSCIAAAKADRERIPRRLGSSIKRRIFINALTNLLMADMDDARIEAYLVSADRPDGKGEDDGDDDSKDGKGEEDADNDGKDGKDKEDGHDSGKDGNGNHPADGMVQGFSSDLPGVIISPDRTNIDRETPNGLSNTELRNALHPIVTDSSSSFHRSGAAAHKNEYPWFHEFGIPVDNCATIYGLFCDIKKRLIAIRETSEELPILQGGFVYESINSQDGLMISIPNSKSKRGQDKLVSAVKEGIDWATRGDSDAETNTMKALFSELAESYEKELVEVGVEENLCLPFYTCCTHRSIR